MTLTGPAILFQESTIGSSAQKLRDAFWGLLAKSGVCGRDALKVVASGSPDQNVQISIGPVFLSGTSVGQGVYADYNDALYPLPMPAADGTFSRWDVVVYRVLDADFMGTDPNTSGGGPHFGVIDNMGHFDYVQGVAASSPSIPTLMRDMIPLAYVFRAANDNAISNGEITDVRPQASAIGGQVICTSTTRPTVPRIGDQIYETDTNQNYMWDGTYWNCRGRALLHGTRQDAWQLQAGQRYVFCIIPLPTLVAPMPVRHILRLTGSFGYAVADHRLMARAWDRLGPMWYDAWRSGDHIYEMWAKAGLYMGFGLTWTRDYNPGETIGGDVWGADWYSDGWNTYFDIQAESTWMPR